MSGSNAVALRGVPRMQIPKFEALSVWFRELADSERNALIKRLPAGTQVDLAPNWLKSLHEAYEDDTKKVIKSQTKGGESARLDRHKVAAALALATLRAQPFFVRGGVSEQTSRTREANVFLGLEVGCIVVLLFGITEANLTENADLSRIYRDVDHTSLMAVPTGNGDGTYLNQLVKAVNFARRDTGPVPNGYSLLLSHIYFLLQCAFERRQCAALDIAPEGDSMNLKVRMDRIDALEHGLS